MSIDLFKNELISIFSGFEKYWNNDDVCKQEDGSFTPHGLLMSFSGLYRTTYNSFSSSQCIALANLIEGVVSSDPKDKLPLANAICTCFLENIAGDAEGEKLRPFLGASCLKYYAHWV